MVSLILPFAFTPSKNAAPLTIEYGVGQAAILYLLYTSTGPWSNGQGLDYSDQPSTFHQVFANAGEVPYCSGLPTDCVTDGAEFDRDGTIFTYDPPTVQQRQRKYRLSGGTNLTVMQEMEVGRQVLVPRIRNEKAFVELSERQGIGREQVMERLGELLYFDVEEVAEEMIGGSV